MAGRKMSGSPQVKGHAPWMRTMQAWGRNGDRSPSMRGGPPWMKNGARSPEMRNGPPWMRGQMQRAGGRHSDSQSQRMNERQQSHGEHHRGAG
ncbi:hypothetical protein OAL01_03440, partial [Rubripirellula sp.]|nr:hypothetical protein [Rubripirellula sp.]